MKVHFELEVKVCTYSGAADSIRNKNLYNLCFIKIRSKHSNNTLLSLLQFFMKQTLEQVFPKDQSIFRINKYQAIEHGANSRC